MRKQQLIVNADDFGLSREVNQAIIELIEQGVVTSTSAMSNMPAFDEVSKIKGRAGIGVHLNLTTGRPVLPEERVANLVDATGHFVSLPTQLLRLRQRRTRQQEIEDEMEAQICLVLKGGIEPDHINSHQSLLKYPQFFSTIKRLARKYRIPGIRAYHWHRPPRTRLLKPMNLLKTTYLEFQRLQLRATGFVMPDCFDSLLRPGLNADQAHNHLDRLATDTWDGVLEFVVHPGYIQVKDESLGTYTREREVERQVLAQSGFEKILRYRGVELISFAGITRSRPEVPERPRAAERVKSSAIG